MADPNVIKMVTGALPGFDRPVVCHSGRPEPNTCYALSHEPGREGWVRVILPPAERRRDGWWCPDCARRLREEMERLGFPVSSLDVPISEAGKA